MAGGKRGSEKPRSDSDGAESERSFAVGFGGYFVMSGINHFMNVERMTGDAASNEKAPADHPSGLFELPG